MFINEYAQLASTDGSDGRENLRRLLAYATREPHSFLFINFKAPPEKRFMLRFEKYLTISNEGSELDAEHHVPPDTGQRQQGAEHGVRLPASQPHGGRVRPKGGHGGV